MEIKRVRLGITNCYLIKGNQGYILVDAGSLRKGKRFLRLLKKLKVDPHEIKLIIITHAHYDHVGTLEQIKKICTCPVAISPQEGEIVSQGLVVIPPGTNLMGKLVSLLGKTFTSVLRFPKCEVDYLITQEFSLEEYGVAGRILPTPGHTAGSLSVILDDGRAMVGDLAMNMPGGKIFPIFAEEPDVIFESWQKLVKNEVKTLYPAHGRPISINKIKARLKRR